MLGKKSERRRAAPRRPPTASPQDDPNRDLGFGSVVSRESKKRLINRDGSFNVERQGLGLFEELSPYQFLLTTSWPRFIAVVGSFYLAWNLLFAALYLACGPGALAGFSDRGGALSPFEGAFFFSVQTFATIGYGVVHPVSLAANWLVTIEAISGMLLFALATGLVWARFARPVATILFSRNAIVAPYRDGAALMLRLANQRRHQLIEVEAQVTLSRFREGTAGLGREFLPLALERDRVALFPLAWTLVHPIDEASPLHGWSLADLEAARTEILVSIAAFDETFAQTIHTRLSYTSDELVWGARFVGLFKPIESDGTMAIDIGKLHDFESTELPRIEVATMEIGPTAS